MSRGPDDPRLLRVVVGEPQPAARARLRGLLGDHSDVQLVALCEDGRKTVNAIRRLKPVFVLMEVDMPGCNAFEVIRRIGQEHMPPTILVSSHHRFAIQAFDLAAIDFVPKPVPRERLGLAIARVRRLHLANRSDRDLQRPERFLVRKADALHLVEVKRIEWIESAGNYSRLYTDGEEHLVRCSLGDLEPALDPRRFARIHRSCIVNIERLRALVRLPTGDYRVLLDNGKELVLSRTFRHQIARFGWRPRSESL